ncbi:hypothetical protein C9374_011371 [Naegleria lovaniensis]|uniref:EGF-like domain-containing protein n=1 Tax=Naegleria lovaniensis TaxID=51637 RepID=A0AA88KQQ2_NAELO|nr:uncharacterized protein C9374_011371 [Naegleria lovaniensis]KAG2392646.1 hypothetical protein C9374_011371 [Naegleria lovaniensis]
MQKIATHSSLFNNRERISSSCLISMLLAGVTVYVVFLGVVQAAVCDLSNVQIEMKGLRDSSMGLPVYDAIYKIQNQSVCLNEIRKGLTDKVSTSIVDFTSACLLPPTDAAYANDPCCGGKNLQCCARRNVNRNAWDVRSNGALSCAVDVSFEAGLAFTPVEQRASLCSAGSLEDLIREEGDQVYQTAGCKYNGLKPEEYLNCLASNPVYGPHVLPSFAKALNLAANSTTSAIVDAMKSQGHLVGECFNRNTQQVDSTITSQSVCETGLPDVCPFSDCSSHNQTCYACKSPLKCNAYPMDDYGTYLDSPLACLDTVLCGAKEHVVSYAECELSKECNVPCFNCTDQATCLKSGMCEGWGTQDPTCAVPIVNNACPVGCTMNLYINMCNCTSSATSDLPQQFNVTLNNFMVPLNNVNNNKCRRGYFELVPPRNADECFKYKVCRYGNGGVAPLSSCSNSMCTNGGPSESFKWIQGQWVKSVSIPLQFANRTLIHQREWRWAPKTSTPFFDSVNFICNFHESIATYVACKCGSFKGAPCDTMSGIFTFVDKVLGLKPANSQNRTAFENLQNGYIVVPPQVLPNVTFVDVMATLRNPKNVWNVFGGVNNTQIGSILGNGISFSAPLKNVRICLNSYPQPTPIVLNGLPVGFVAQDSTSLKPILVPTYIEGNSVCATMDVMAGVFYYPYVMLSASDISCNGIVSTAPNVCSGFGKCIAQNTCQCYPGRYGANCGDIAPPTNNTYYCNGVPAYSASVCSGSGKCVGPNMCQCMPDRYGYNCENFLCYGKSIGACSYNGLCVAPNTCQCKPNFAGAECSQCASGYTGMYCERPMCYGVDSLNKYVCSGNGACVAPNKCSCKPGAYGERCEQFTCGEIGKPQCSGHGICVGPQMCSCNASTTTGYWGGSNCEMCQPSYSGAQCTERSCSAATTCLGRGTCNPDYTCTCTGNFAGPYCRTCKDGFFGPYCNVTCDPMKTCSGNGVCTTNGGCTCNSNSLLGMFTGSSCSQCQSGWMGVKCNIYIGSSATFGSEGDRIRFTLAFPSPTNQIDCAAIFSPLTLAKLGAYPQCRWEDRSNNLFMVILGGASSLIPGDSLTIQNGDISRTLSLSGSLSLPAPIAILRTPRNVSSCSTFFFDASASYSFDRRPVSFSWSLSGPGSLSAINAKLATVTGSFGYFSASALSSGTYTLTVTVTSAFNYTSTASSTFGVSSTPTAIVRIPGGESYRVNMGSMFSIYPYVEYPSCYYFDRTLIWTWTQVSGPANAQLTLRDNNRALVFLQNAFSAAGDYVFKVKAVSAVSSASYYETQVTVTVVAPDLVLLVEGGYYKQASTSGQLVLDFSRSFDPAQASGTETFTISCLDAAAAAACSLNTANLVVNKKAVIAAGALAAGQYTFTVTYSKGSRSISDTIDVSMVSYVVLNPYIRLGRFDWIPSSVPLGVNVPFFVDLIGFTTPNVPVSFQWSSLTDGFELNNETTVKGVNGRSLIIKGDYIAAGVEYQIRADVTAGSASGYAVFVFSVNSPPLPGSISASLATSSAGVDPVTITCDGWYDSDAPLTYQYFYYDLNRGVWRSLSGRTSDNQITTKLPPGFGTNKKLRIRARVYDSKNAYSDIELSIVSTPPDLSSGTAALNFLNQSSSATDSTANSVAVLSNLANISQASMAANVVAQIKTFIMNVITAVLAQRSAVAVTVEDAAETISFLTTATAKLDLVDANTRGQMLQSTASSLNALASSSRPITPDLVDSITVSLSSFIKNILSGAASSRRSILTSASEAQSIIDNANTLQTAMMKSLVPDQAASVSASTDLIAYTKKISVSSSSSFSDTVSSPVAISFASTFSSVVSSVTTLGVRIKQMSNLYKLIYPQSMTILSPLFEIAFDDQDTGASVTVKGTTMTITMGGNYTNTATSYYVCNIWNNSTKVFEKDSTCSIKAVTSTSATIQVTQGGTYALSQYTTTATSSPVTPKPNTSKSTTKPAKSAASTSMGCSLLLIIASILYTLFITV